MGVGVGGRARISTERVVVAGGRGMGNGITQVVASSGLRVTLVDVQDAALERALGGSSAASPAS